jgi:hypothetical protein
MRFVLALLIGLLAAAAPAFAQNEKPLSTLDLSGTWQGNWVSPKGYLYTTTLSLRVTSDGLASGSFAWVLKRSPRPEDQRLLGSGATEYVSGRTNTTARTVTLAGTRKDDPDGVIGLDRYKMVLSDDGRVMGGITYNHGDWQGQIVLAKETPTQ